MKTRRGSSASRVRSSYSFAARCRRCPATRDAARRAVDPDLPRLQHLGRARAGPPEQRLDPRPQLLVGERPVEVVVGPALEGADAIDEGVALLRAEQDDGDVAVPGAAGLALPEPEAELELGEEDEIRTQALGQVERLAGGDRRHNLEAVLDELPLEEPTGRALGLGDDQGSCHSPTVAPAPRARLVVIFRDFAPKDEQPSTSDLTGSRRSSARRRARRT